MGVNMIKERQEYFKNLDKAHTIEITLYPNCKFNPVFVVHEKELEIFKKYYKMALKEVWNRRI